MSKKKEAPSPFDFLDKAIMDKFPDVEAKTQLNIFAMAMVTTWWQRGRSDDVKLKPHRANQVRAFVAGFMAAWEAKV